MADPDSIPDGILASEFAARFAPKAYETPPDRHTRHRRLPERDRGGFQKNYMDIPGGGVLTMQYTAQCGWAAVIKAWQDNDVAGILFRVPHESDGESSVEKGHFAWVVRYEQTAYISGM